MKFHGRYVLQGVVLVTLHVRVWIEIDTKSMISLLVMVTLHVRVWIEIGRLTKHIGGRHESPST